ncbi:MAG: hypothetical protein ACRD2Z_03235 [Thermoanaerobaculia bacterium]
MSVDQRERTAAVVLGEDLAELLSDLDTASQAIGEARSSARMLGKRTGHDLTLRAGRQAAQALGTIDQLSIEPARRLIEERLEELDNVYGISEAVKW